MFALTLFLLCAFCDEKILDAQTVYRGEHASVLVTYQPAAQGHLLIIPNRHVPMYHELSPEEIAEMGSLVQRTQAVIERLYGAREYLLLQKNGALSGQTVPHVHIHFLPRHEATWTATFITSVLTAWFWPPLSPEKLEAYRQEVSRAFLESDAPQTAQSPLPVFAAALSE